MTARFCATCAAPVGPDTAICAACGHPVAPAQGGQAPAAPYAQSQGAPHPQQPGAPYGGPQTGVPYGATAQGGTPWGSAAPQSGGAAGRGAIDALLGGDWRGAVKAAGFSVLAMLALGLVGVLLLAAGELGFREVVALTAGAVCTAVGGDVFVETSADIFSGDEFFDSGGEEFFGGGVVSGSGSVGLLPLTLTLTGLTLLAWLFIRSLRARGVHRGRDVLLQGARTALVFTVLFLPLALLTRHRIDESDDTFGTIGRVGVSVWSTLTGAVLFAVATLGLVWLFSRQTRGGLPTRLAAVRAQVVVPLLGALAVFAAGLLGVLAFLIYSLVQYDERVAQLGVLVLGGGNGALASVLWSAGVPLGTDAGFAGAGLGAGASEGVDLFTFTDESAWVWLAPVVLLLVLVAVATVLTVRQNSVVDARREGFRFAGALAVVAFAAALLLRVSTEFSGGVSVFGGTADASATFNPLIAAVALGLWGLVAGLLGPVLATRISSSLVTRLRGRFGVAAPRPAPGAGGQGWQQPGGQQPTQQFAAPPYQQPQPQPQPYAPQTYAPQPYAPQPYAPQPYAPQPHEQPPYPQQQPLPPVPPPSQ
ncbi:hypothetical protein SAMN05660662_3835 [Blastococcus aurantiacus]|uniref:Uncharacterized protein n=1 Tax=Blastococcus aurantiacus TaxID=1550231 RepID=A0A1G7PZU1_9ACTN|nr:streptophobe family protein [Blastococcus aurantiacus]SDF91776.1 hypothetical protein SAMN05660662_3835 [Blastococcus aurantiacus]